MTSIADRDVSVIIRALIALAALVSGIPGGGRPRRRWLVELVGVVVATLSVAVAVPATDTTMPLQASASTAHAHAPGGRHQPSVPTSAWATEMRSVPAESSASTRLATARSRPATPTGFAAEGAESGLADAADSCLNSFSADTPVLMADGKEEPLADVKVGDKVLATDPETGRTEARAVAALIRHSGKHTMVDLTLSDGSKITTTDHHPFWDATSRTFTDAIDLSVGDQVLSDHGRRLTITGSHVYDRDLTAYNLQIDAIHTYYAGTTPVLVHNSCGPESEFEIKTRADPGSDGGISHHLIEKVDGQTVSVTHQVEVDGEIVHQHQRYVGVSGDQRYFPSE